MDQHITFIAGDFGVTPASNTDSNQLCSSRKSALKINIYKYNKSLILPFTNFYLTIFLAYSLKIQQEQNYHVDKKIKACVQLLRNICIYINEKQNNFSK